MTKEFYNLFATNQQWIKDSVVYLTIHGSHSYGTNIATSDMDYRGFAIPPKEYFFGYQKNFENYVQKEPDLTIFELRKFFRLALENNPNVLEILYTNPEHHIHINPIIESILDNKHLFLSKKAKHTFSGYAVSQLKRIQRHYSWIKNPPKQPPSREEFGLSLNPVIPKSQLDAVNAAIRKQIDQWNWHELENVEPSVRQAIQTQFETNLCEIMQWHWKDIEDKIWYSSAKQIGIDDNFIELMATERKYTSKLKEWNQYQDWKKNRNKTRAFLEEQHGYDVKHGMHLVRLLRMCHELLEFGQMNVYRKYTDADELIYIRNGGWSYERLLDYAIDMESRINSLYITSKVLPDRPDYDSIEKICIEIIQKWIVN
jgi:predicted nucleotidyltransferase